MIAMLLVMLTGAVSAWLYGRARRWADAALIGIAALALAGLLGDFKIPAALEQDVLIEPRAVIDLQGARSVRIDGDGMSAARWRDLPARPLHWDGAAGESLQLDFPRSVPPGGVFTLTANFGKLPAWRLQLLAEDGRVLAQSPGGGARQAVQWTPPVIEDIVLRARLLDAQGRRITEGPVPLRVEAPPPLRVRGRFSAPSFDVRTLRTLFEDSGALLDWQVTLGAGVVAVEAPRAPIAVADLIVIDAPWLERRDEADRAALLAQVEEGARLLVLGTHVRDRGMWARLLALELRGAASGVRTGPLPMTHAPWQPVASPRWSAAGALASRPYGAGRIGWLAVADWHRHAIAEPRALALWWQDILGRLTVARTLPFAWAEPEAMPLAGQRLEVCAYGAAGAVSFPQLRQTLAWQRRTDRADAACVAVWPIAPGWLQVTSGEQSTRIFVYAATHWPAWQAALAREATARYAARTPAPAEKRDMPLPAWPFAAVFALAMLGLWWRERGAPQAPAPGDPAG